MKEIKLTRGFIAQVDDEDFEFLNQWKWFARIGKNTVYAVRMEQTRLGECKSYKERKDLWMHRVILKLDNSDSRFSDHKDHNGLNNQKYNLRIATRTQNNSNKKSCKESTSKYLGVSKCNQTGKWKAQIKDGKYTNLGRFDTEEQAAVAYNERAIIVHGEFANLNKV